MRHYIPVLIILVSSFQFSCGKNDTPINLGVAHSCDAAESVCTLSAGKHSLTLELGPNVKPLIPFETIIKLKSVDAKEENVVVDFRMVGMDMGMNRYRLIQHGDVWSGKVTLPVCVASRTDWLAVVEFSDSGKHYIASFPFHTDAN